MYRILEEYMNINQKSLLINFLYGLAILLCFIFIRLGSRLDYSNIFMIVPLSRVSNTNAYDIYGPSTLPWGLLARKGVLGVFMGVILPVILVAIATFIKKSDQP